MKAHFFDLDTIIRIDNKVWIIDKKNPNNPILKISQSDFNLIRKGIYRSHNQRLSLNGTNYWFPEEIMNQIKIKGKRIKFDLGNLGFSMQEFSNSEIIKDLNYEINLDLFNHIKNTTDHIYIICSKNNKRNYDLIIEKIEDKLHDLGLEIKNYYFISETFYNRNQDDITFKKVRILLQHLVGYKTEGDKFIDEEIENYSDVYYYDDDIDSVNLSTTLNDFFKVFLDNTDKTVGVEITKKLKDEENHLYVNYVSPNVVNRLQTKKVLLQAPNIIKTFESFNWKKG